MEGSRGGERKRRAGGMEEALRVRVSRFGAQVMTAGGSRPGMRSEEAEIAAVAAQVAKKAHYAGKDHISAMKKYMIENKLACEQELKAIEKKIDEILDDSEEFADGSPKILELDLMVGIDVRTQNSLRGLLMANFFFRL